MKIYSYKSPCGKNTRIAKIMAEGKQTAAGHGYDGDSAVPTHYSITGEAEGRAFTIELTTSEAQSVIEAWQHGMQR